MRVPSSSAGLLGALLVGTLAGCNPPVWPGEPVGTFHVVGTLEDNTCGTMAVPAQEEVVFSAEIRTDGSQAFWRRPQAAIIYGAVGADGTFTFRLETQASLTGADPDGGTANCVLSRQEVLAVRVMPSDDGGVPAGDGGGPAGNGSDAGADDGGAANGDAGAALMLEGTHDITFTPVAGSDCTLATAASGGPFLGLPCALHYQLAGLQGTPF